MQAVLDLNDPIKALAQLYISRKEAKDAVYEMTGISDIVRGVSKPTETLGAQEIKSQWGALRIQDRRRDIEAMVVSILRMKAHIIATLFEPETLTEMSGIDATPELMALLQNDGLRGYRIDVETDSILATDRTSDQRAVGALVEALTKYFQVMVPLVAQGFPMAVAKEIALAAIKPYPQFGRALEDAINQIPSESSPSLAPPTRPAMSAGPAGGAPPPPAPQLAPNVVQMRPPGLSA